jgi:hypothetical protein
LFGPALLGPGAEPTGAAEAGAEAAGEEKVAAEPDAGAKRTPTGAAAAGEEAEAAAELSDVTGRARSEDEPETEGLCNCSGNCGWTLCKRNQGVRARSGAKQICSERVSRLPGAVYCTRCQCEEEACIRPRMTRWERRWCCQHGRAAADTPWRRQDDWGVELNLVSKLAPVLQHLLPDDVSCVSELGRQLGGVPGTPVRGLDFFFLGHAVKWPPVVRRMAHLLHEVGIFAPLDTPRGVADGPEGLAAIKEFAAEVVNILQELVQFAEQGTPEWNELFSGLRVGFLALSSGLGPLATELGLLARKGQPAWRRVKLGTQLYCVVPGPTAVAAVVDRVASMLRAAFNVEVESMVGTWPSTAEQVPGFLEHGLSVVKEIRRVGGLTGGQSERHQYLVLSFVRSALVAQIAARLPGAMDTHTMAQVA